MHRCALSTARVQLRANALRPETQLHSALALGYICSNDANRKRLVELGGLPTLLNLAQSLAWRSKETLGGVLLSLANMTMSDLVRKEVATSGGAWKAVLALIISNDKEFWFNALRILANLALEESMQLRLVQGGVVAGILKAFAQQDPDIQVLPPAGSRTRCSSREQHATKFDDHFPITGAGNAAAWKPRPVCFGRCGGDAHDQSAQVSARLRCMPPRYLGSPFGFRLQGD